ncbi:MAG: prenyltransferase [Anaerolineaceae bacterium]
MNEQPEKSILRQFIEISSPWFLVGGALFYMLGIGIAHYLGIPMRIAAFWEGMACVVLLQVSSQYLKAYFDGVGVSDERRQVEPGKLTRRMILIAAVSTLTIGAVMTVLVYRDGYLTGPTMIVLAASFGIAFFYSAPPLRLGNSGYGELISSILIANMIPAFAFLLQAGELHRLVAMSTFPLTAQVMASMLMFSFPDYSLIPKGDRRTLLDRMGWRRGMALHNYLLLFSYLILVSAALFGFPWRIAWQPLLTIPLSLFQIWQMGKIADGQKPRWQILVFVSLMIPALTAYLMTASFWIG